LKKETLCNHIITETFEKLKTIHGINKQELVIGILLDSIIKELKRTISALDRTRLINKIDHIITSHNITIHDKELSLDILLGETINELKQPNITIDERKRLRDMLEITLDDVTKCILELKECNVIQLQHNHVNIHPQYIEISFQKILKKISGL
jgi:hypothetical protein